VLKIKVNFRRIALKRANSSNLPVEFYGEITINLKRIESKRLNN
jgi:hypothetical protein